MNNKQGKSGMLSLILAFALAGGGMAFGLSQQSDTKDHAGSLSEIFLLNANTLIGNTVIDQSGNELGTVEDLQFDKSSGRIFSLILSSGGGIDSSLGMKADTYSLPWADVVGITNEKNIVVHMNDIS
jgi:sporulation protein YlmC with PRC-barrel domain